MSNQLKNLLSVVTMSFVMIGCSSGSNSSNSDSSTPAVDNSVLADGENPHGYGYFGTQVIFGKNLVVGKWSLDLVDYDHLWNFDYTEDGTKIYVGGLLDGFSDTYGVSKEGSELKSTQGTIRILENLDGDCYSVEHVFLNHIDDNSTDTYVGTFCKK